MKMSLIGRMSETDGVGAGRNDVEILNTRNCLFGIEDGARTTTRQAPPQVLGDGDDGEGGEGCAASPPGYTKMVAQ